MSAHTARGGLRAAVLLVAAALCLLVAAPAGAKIVTTKSGKRFSIVPNVAASKASALSCTTSCSALTYHNGPVQHGEKDYLIFWQPSGFYIPPAYKSGLSQWFTDVGKADYTPGNVMATNQQYFDHSGPAGANSYVPYAITNGGVITATDALPANGCADTDGGGAALPHCLTDAQIQTEIKKVVAAKGLPQNLNTEYFLFTPNSVGSCFDSTSTSCSYSSFCAYHGSMTGTTAGSTIVYANMPWGYLMNGCDVDLAFGTGYANADALDTEVGVVSHELSETMTDPQLNAWYDSSGNENGDKCAYTYGSGGYGSTTGLANNGLGYWNQLISGDQYLLQQEFSNRNSNCMSTDTDTQPNVSIGVSPASPAHGASATYTATVTDPAGLNQIIWSFGDGTASVTTTTNSTTHTYATAGTKTVTAIVTDGHGNEKKVTKSVTVT